MGFRAKPRVNPTSELGVNQRDSLLASTRRDPGLTDRMPTQTYSTVLLVGGYGTRMHELTEGRMPKALVEVGGKPLLDYTLESLTYKGIVDDVIFAVGHHSKRLVNWVSEQERGFDFDFSRQQTPGIAAAVMAAANRTVSQNLIVGNGDEIHFNLALRDALLHHEQSRALVTAVVTNPANTLAQSMMFDIGHDGSVKGAAKPQELTDEQIASGNWLKHAGVTIMRREAIKHIDPTKRNWDDGVNLPLVHAGVLKAYVDVGVVFFNVNSRREVHAATRYMNSLEQ